MMSDRQNPLAYNERMTSDRPDPHMTNNSQKLIKKHSYNERMTSDKRNLFAYNEDDKGQTKSSCDIHFFLFKPGSS